MSQRVSTDTYRALIEQVRDCISLHVPYGSAVLIASKGDDELTRIDGYRGWHFPQNDAGVYAGHHPADSAEAIAHLRQLYAKGARYLVLPWTARWWLEHYRELAKHLETVHELTVSRQGVCVIYELRAFRGADACDALEDADEPPDDSAAAFETSRLVSLVAPDARPVPRVLTILARCGRDRYPNADREIADIFRRRMPEIERTVVIVDNALPRDVVEEREGAVLLGGDNTSWEFSAFDRALDFVGSDIWSYDFVHFATSAFNTLYVAYLDRFDTRLLQALTGQAVCLGHIDCYNEPIEVLTYRSQHWIRSCFFFVPPAEIKALGSLVTIADGSRFFSGNPDEAFRVDAPISRRFREYITQWLTGHEIGQGVEWHSHFALTRETVPAFEQKARAILNEHLLGIRLRALGCHPVDVTWLSTMLRCGSPLEISFTIPWREQLATRDRDALIVQEQRLDSVGIAR
jgi:hypothetical protein